MHDLCWPWMTPGLWNDVKALATLHFCLPEKPPHFHAYNEPKCSPRPSKLSKIAKKARGYKDMKLQGHEALGYKRPAGGAEHLNKIYDDDDDDDDDEDAGDADDDEEDADEAQL